MHQLLSNGQTVGVEHESRQAKREREREQRARVQSEREDLEQVDVECKLHYATCTHPVMSLAHLASLIRREGLTRISY